MPRFSAFTPFGHLAFSGKPSHGESIYRTLRDNFGDAFTTDFNSVHQTRLYAIAICLAASQYQLDRAVNNRNPLKATELLPALEHEYQVIPSPRATFGERRAYLAAFQKVTRGNRREAMEDALRTLLGADFLEYRTTQPADIVATPAQPWTVGVFLPPGAKKKVFRIESAVTRINTQITVPITPLGGTDAPLFGEHFCVDPDPRRNIEQILVQGAAPGLITAIFSKSHEPGSIAVCPHPWWISNQRVVAVVVTLKAATDLETRRKINELMARAARSVTQWSIIHNEGVFTPDDPVLGLPDCVPVS